MTAPTETTPKVSWQETPVRTELHVLVGDDHIIINPGGNYDLMLPAVYTGRALSAMRQVQEGAVLDMGGIVASQTDQTKCYIYDESLKMMIEGHKVVEGHRQVYRVSRRQDLSLIPSKGYYYNWTHPETGEIREVRLTYDSHHLAWLIAQGVRLFLPNTPRTLETLGKWQEFTAAGDRTSFTKAFWAHHYTD